MASIVLSVDQYVDDVDNGTVYPEDDIVVLQGPAEALGELSLDAIGALDAVGVDLIEVSGNQDRVTMPLDKALALAATGTILAANTRLAVPVTAESIATLAESDIAALAALGEVALTTEGAISLTLTFARARAMANGGITLDGGDTITISATSDDFATLSPDEIAALHRSGIDTVDAGTPIDLTVEQAAALVDTDFGFLPEDAVRIVDAGQDIAQLDAMVMYRLVTKGVDRFDALDDRLALSLVQLDVIGGRRADEDVVTLADTGRNIALLPAESFGGLAQAGIVAIDATDNRLGLRLDQIDALGTGILTAGDLVFVSEGSTTLAILSGDRLAQFAAKGVDLLDASDDVVALTAGQSAVLAASHLAYAAGDAVTVLDAGDALDDLLPAQIALLGDKGVDLIDVRDNTVSLTALQGAALAGTNVGFAAEDGVTIVGTDIGLASLTAAQITSLIAKGADLFDESDDEAALSLAQLAALTGRLSGSDHVVLVEQGGTIRSLTVEMIRGLAASAVVAIDATDDVLSLSLAQVDALGTVALATGDAVTLSEAGSVLGVLSADQLRALAGKGIDKLDASNDVLSLSLGQFNALGTVTLTAADTVTVVDAGSALVSLTTAQMGTLGRQGVDVCDLVDNAATLSSAQLAALSSVDFAAGDRLTVNGTAGADTITGKSSSDVIKGLSRNDAITGGSGNDQLWGGTGKDVLTGGGGQDVFVFDAPLSKANVDKIADYSVADDTVWLDNKSMKKLGKGSPTKPQKLNKKFFAFDKAKDGNDYIVYVKKTGALYYDQDGSGAKAAVQVATLTKNLKTLSAMDFFVI